MEIFHNGIENGAVGAGLAELLRGGASVAEQPFKHDSRIVLCRQRCRGAAPGQRIEIGAAVTVLTLAAQKVQIDGKLERRQRGVFPKLSSGNLVGGNTIPHVGAFGVLRVHSGQPGTRPACVVSICAVIESIGLVLRKSADDQHTVAIRSEWGQDRRQLEAGALTFGCPVVDPFEVSRNAVRTVDETESLNR